MLSQIRTALAAALLLSGCQAVGNPSDQRTEVVGQRPPEHSGLRLHCAPRAQALAFIARFGEHPQTYGLSGGALIEWHANPTTGTWTLLMTLADGMSCIWGAGRDWRGPGDGPGTLAPAERGRSEGREEGRGT